MRLQFYFLLLLLLFSIVLRLFKKNINTITKEELSPLRVICAYLIIVHHVAQHYYSAADRDLWSLSQFCDWGAVIVKIFFFLSGFGLLKVYMFKGPDYLNDFISRRIGSVFYPLFFVTILYLVFCFFTGYDNFNFRDVFLGETPLPNSWFVYELLLFYFFFYGSAKIAKNDYVLLVGLLWVLSFFLYNFFIFVAWRDYWRLSIFAFNIGTTFAYYEKNIMNLLQNKGYIVLFVSVILLFVCRYLPYFDAVFCHIPFADFPQAYFPVWVVLLFCYYVGLRKLSFLKSISGISYEIYLVQGALIVVSSHFVKDSSLLMICVLCLSTLFAWMIHIMIKNLFTFSSRFKF